MSSITTSRLRAPSKFGTFLRFSWLWSLLASTAIKSNQMCSLPIALLAHVRTFPIPWCEPVQARHPQGLR